MSGEITYAQAKANLDLWIEADQKVAKGQSYEIDGIKVTRADADLISNKIDYWMRWCKRLGSTRRGIGLSQIVPNDL